MVGFDFFHSEMPERVDEVRLQRSKRKTREEDKQEAEAYEKSRSASTTKSEQELQATRAQLRLVNEDESSKPRLKPLSVNTEDIQTERSAKLGTFIDRLENVLIKFANSNFSIWGRLPRIEDTQSAGNLGEQKDTSDKKILQFSTERRRPAPDE